MQDGADSDQHPSGASGQVHGQPEHFLAGERRATLVVDRVPGQPSDVITDRAIPRATPVAEIQDHARPTREEPGRGIERRSRGAADTADRGAKLVIVSVGEVLVEDKTDAGATVS